MLVHGPLVGAQLDRTTRAASAPEIIGLVWIDPADGIVKFSDGTETRSITTTTNPQSLTNKTLITALSNELDFINQSTPPATGPSGQNLRLVNLNGVMYLQDSTRTLSQLVAGTASPLQRFGFIPSPRFPEFYNTSLFLVGLEVTEYRALSALFYIEDVATIPDEVIDIEVLSTVLHGHRAGHDDRIRSTTTSVDTTVSTSVIPFTDVDVTVNRATFTLSSTGLSRFLSPISVESIVPLERACEVFLTVSGGIDLDYFAEGHFVTLSGMTNTENDGTFEILQVHQDTARPSVVIDNAAAIYAVESDNTSAFLDSGAFQVFFQDPTQFDAAYYPVESKINLYTADVLSSAVATDLEILVVDTSGVPFLVLKGQVDTDEDTTAANGYSGVFELLGLTQNQIDAALVHDTSIEFRLASNNSQEAIFTHLSGMLFLHDPAGFESSVNLVAHYDGYYSNDFVMTLTNTDNLVVGDDYISPISLSTETRSLRLAMIDGSNYHFNRDNSFQTLSVNASITSRLMVLQMEDVAGLAVQVGDLVAISDVTVSDDIRTLVYVRALDFDNNTVSVDRFYPGADRDTIGTTSTLEAVDYDRYIIDEISTPVVRGRQTLHQFRTGPYTYPLPVVYNVAVTGLLTFRMKEVPESRLNIFVQLDSTS